MAPSSPSSSPGDRRNISSLLNPSENMDTSNSSPPTPHAQLDSHPQHITQGQQPPGIPPTAVLVQSTPESNSFRLSRASWGGDGPPPDGLEGSSQKQRISNSTEESESKSTRQKGSTNTNGSATPDGATVGTKGNVSKKTKGTSKVARAKAAAATLPPSHIQYPTEPYTPVSFSHCTQPSVGLGEAVATPLPLAPPRLPPRPAPRVKWKKSKQQQGSQVVEEVSEPAASQFQASDRVSVRLAARESSSNTSPQSAAAIPELSHGEPGPHGQPFEQNPNSNGKRPLQEDGENVKEGGKRKKKDGAVPGNGSPQALNGFCMPIPMNMSGGNAGELPLDPSFFTGAGPSHSSGAYSNYMPPGEPSFLRNPPQPPRLFDPPQPPLPSQPPQYAIDGAMQPEKLVPELQFARCMSNRYKPDPFPRCLSCTRRWAGDTCRFQGIRFFLRDPERRVLGVSFVDSQTAESPSMKFPNSWNVPLEATHIRRIKHTVAKALLPTLIAEQAHLRLPEVIRRPRETEVRVTCDTCMTSIFACSWMCRLCGREACEECIKQVRELTHPTRAVTASGEKRAHSNPLFLSCTKRQEHALRDFSPVSRFCCDELEGVVRDMEQLIKEESDRAAGHVPVNGHTIWTAQDQADAISNLPGPIMTTTETSSMRTSPEQTASGLSLGPSLGSTGPEHAKSPEHGAVHPPQGFIPVSSVPLPPPVAARYGDPLDPAQVPSHPYYVFDRTMSDDQFQPLWAVGEVVVVTGLLSDFNIHWTPDYFIQNFDQNKCLILECHTDENKSINVGEFFSHFGMYAGRTKCWKLKDWPPSSDFKTTFPDLYEDFNRAVPIPNYTRRDGVLNVASHFPSNTIAPDIGPKMYNAFASSEMPGAKGSTRLHMDMADAVNIMLYSAKRPDGGEGMAAWDIFRSEDTPKLRRFLRKRFKSQFTNDPIHSQSFFLDIHMRRQLFDEFGVSSWRLYQRPGDAVFIPAGCAHQVVNLADCIKVACDFVSPENVNRCSALTREFREQNQTQTWKEDVLQLSAMLWYCWLNLCRVEKDLTSQDTDSIVPL